MISSASVATVSFSCAVRNLGAQDSPAWDPNQGVVAERQQPRRAQVGQHGSDRGRTERFQRLSTVDELAGRHGIRSVFLGQNGPQYKPADDSRSGKNLAKLGTNSSVNSGRIPC